LSFWRWISGAAILFPFVASGLGKTIPLYRQHWRTFALLGVLMIGSTSLILVGLKFTSATNTSLINATQPTITALLCWLFFRDRLSFLQWAGIVIAFTGIAQIIARADWLVLRSLSINQGDLIQLTAMFGFATYAINIRKIPSVFTAAEALFAVIMFGSIALIPFYLAETLVYKPMPFTGQTVVVVVTLSLLVSVLGMLFWTRGNQLIGPNRAAVYMNLIPPFGAILAFVFLDESIAAYHLIGGVMICGGMWLTLRKQ
jgi:drug/metabolite transporter (DMT)-like permease